MITIEDRNIINEISELKQLTPATARGLIYAVELYTSSQDASFSYLLKEAEREEESGILMKKRKIKTRLNNFILFLKAKGLRNSSINNILARVKSVYNYYEITLPRLQPIKQDPPETFQEIPTKQDIKNAINIATTKIKALISFMASSGTARNETSKLTIKDFITATKEYHHEDELPQALQKMKNHEEIIPTWIIQRQKTGVQYYTYSSPESTKYIISMLNERMYNKNVEKQNLLFEIQPATISTHFRTINDRLNMGRKKTRRFFHSHALRKYFSTTLFAAGASVTDINFYLGHRLDPVTSAYIKANPQTQKEKYKQYVNYLSFNETIIKVDDDEIKQLKNRINKLESMINLLDNSL